MERGNRLALRVHGANQGEDSKLGQSQRTVKRKEGITNPALSELIGAHVLDADLEGKISSGKSQAGRAQVSIPEKEGWSIGKEAREMIKRRGNRGWGGAPQVLARAHTERMVKDTNIGNTIEQEHEKRA